MSKIKFFCWGGKKNLLERFSGASGEWSGSISKNWKKALSSKETLGKRGLWGTP